MDGLVGSEGNERESKREGDDSRHTKTYLLLVLSNLYVLHVVSAHGDCLWRCTWDTRQDLDPSFFGLYVFETRDELCMHALNNGTINPSQDAASLST